LGSLTSGPDCDRVCSAVNASTHGHYTVGCDVGTNSRDRSLAQRLLVSPFTPPPAAKSHHACSCSPSFFCAWQNATFPYRLRLRFLFTIAFYFQWLALLQRESPLLHASLWLSADHVSFSKLHHSRLRPLEFVATLFRLQW